MSTHYIPGLGHRTYVDGDDIPVDAIPRPTIDSETHSISNTERGYEILEVPVLDIQVKQDITDLQDRKVVSTDERLDRLERLLSKFIGI